LTHQRTRTTRPLRSGPVTGPSPLLRGGPSPCRASVLSRLAVSAAWGSPFHRPTSTRLPASSRRGVPTFPCQRPNRARAASMPDNHQGSRQVSPWLIPGQQLDPGSDCHRYAYDTSSAVHLRSPSRSPPDASRAPFPWCSSPPAHSPEQPTAVYSLPLQGGCGGPTSMHRHSTATISTIFYIATSSREQLSRPVDRRVTRLADHLRSPRLIRRDARRVCPVRTSRRPGRARRGEERSRLAIWPVRTG